MNRRQFLTAASTGPFVLRASAAPVNLLFICSDQHQREASGCYGSREVLTPHIDEIARRATRFDRVYCQAPVCVPSRGSIVTGVYPHTHGAKILDDALPEDARTIGHFFRERGYVTGAIGKMHFVDETDHHGFDHRLHLDDFMATLDEGGARHPAQGSGRGGRRGGPSFQTPGALLSGQLLCGGDGQVSARESEPAVLPVVVVLHAAYAAGSYAAVLRSVRGQESDAAASAWITNWKTVFRAT